MIVPYVIFFHVNRFCSGILLLLLLREVYVFIDDIYIHIYDVQVALRHRRLLYGGHPMSS